MLGLRKCSVCTVSTKLPAYVLCVALFFNDFNWLRALRALRVLPIYMVGAAGALRVIALLSALVLHMIMVLYLPLTFIVFCAP